MKDVVPPSSAVEDEAIASENGLPSTEPALSRSDSQRVSYASMNLFTLLLSTLAPAWIGQALLTRTPPDLWAGAALLTLAQRGVRCAGRIDAQLDGGK